MRARATSVLLLLAAAAVAAAAAAQDQPQQQQDPSSPPPPPLRAAAAAADDPASSLPDAGSPDCAADATTVDLSASRNLAIELAASSEDRGFVVATGVVIAVGSGARCSGGGGGGGGGGAGGGGPRLDLAYGGGPAAADENDNNSGSLSLLLYLQCVHWGVASCRRNEDDATSQLQNQAQPGVDGTLARACVVVVRVPPPPEQDANDTAQPPPPSPCSLAQGGKYTFLLKEEDDPNYKDDACAGQGRYVFAGRGGVWESVRPGSGLAACAPWPSSPEPPGPAELQRDDNGGAYLAVNSSSSSLGELGALLTGASGWCPGGFDARKEALSAGAWAAACPVDASGGGGGEQNQPILPPGVRRGACDPSSGIVCLPRAGCPNRMMAGQLLLPGLPADAGGGGGEGEGEGAPPAAAAAAAFVDRVTGFPQPGCGPGYERARAQGVRVKRMRAAQEGGGGKGGGGAGGPLMPRKLGLATLAEAAGVATTGGGGGGR